MISTFFGFYKKYKIFIKAICFGAEEAWTLIGEMISQVGRMHNRFGLRWFHIGADEVFQMGACNASLAVIEQQAGGSKENVRFCMDGSLQFIQTGNQTTSCD